MKAASKPLVAMVEYLEEKYIVLENMVLFHPIKVILVHG